MYKQVLRASLTAVCGLVAVLAIAPAASAWDASVPPVKVDDNPKCADFGLTAITKFDPVNSGTQAGITLTKHDTYYVKWTSTVAVDAVIVKGGPDANVYTYPADTYGDDWLHAPMNGDKPYGLSHVEFCTDGKDTPKPAPGISVTKEAAVDAAYPGETVDFTITAENTGNVVLTDVSIVDAKCDGGTLTRTVGDASFDPGETWTWTCSIKVAADHAAGDPSVTNTAKVCGTGASSEGPMEVCDEDGDEVPVRHPAIVTEKVAVASPIPAGDVAHFLITVTNTGDVELTGYAFTDTRCDGGSATQTGGDTDATFGVGEIRTYSCAVDTAPSDTDDVVNNACATGKDGGVTVKSCDDATVVLTPPGTPVHPAILTEKAPVASPILAGGAAQFTIKVTNTGDVALTGYTFADTRCDGGTATQTGGDTDDSFGVGEVRTYSCSVATAATDTAPVVNTACAEGMYGDTEVSSCDEATVTLTPPSNGGTPPAVTPPVTTPGGGVLPETVVSGRARLSGRSGCLKQAFRARVTGRSIAAVAFYVDGKLVKRLSGPRSRYAVRIHPRRYGFGRHSIVARVTFAAASGTQPRRLRLTFRRCAQGAVAPRFTG